MNRNRIFRIFVYVMLAVVLSFAPRHPAPHVPDQPTGPVVPQQPVSQVLSGKTPTLSEPWPFPEFVPPAGLTAEQVYGTPELRNIFNRRLNYLISEHPEESISRELKSAIHERRELFVTITPVPSHTLAYFATFNGVAGFGVDVQSIMTARTEYEILNLMLSVYHEADHYHYWLKASTREQSFFEVLTPAVKNPESCASRWHAERQAYQVQCALAARWNMTEIDAQLCTQANDPAGFDSVLRMILVSTTEVSPEWEPCIRTWAELAGHPNPQVFGR